MGTYSFVKWASNCLILHYQLCGRQLLQKHTHFAKKNTIQHWMLYKARHKKNHVVNNRILMNV